MSNQQIGSSKEIQVGLVQQHPNLLIETWLEELLNDKLEANNIDEKKKIKFVLTIETALDSLRRFPVTLDSGRSCLILKGFNEKICYYLDKKFSQHSQAKKANYVQEAVVLDDNEDSERKIQESLPVQPLPIQTSNLYPSRRQISNHNKKNKAHYMPAYRSGGYALLLTLYEHNKKNPEKGMIKKDLQNEAQPLCESSFTVPPSDSRYTAWSSMSTLLKKNLVEKNHENRSIKYKITDLGFALCLEMIETYRDTLTPAEALDIGIENSFANNYSESNSSQTQIERIEIGFDVGSSESQVNTECGRVDIETDTEIALFMPAGSFDIILLIDKQETQGSNSKNDPIVNEFNKHRNCKHEYRHLKVGDFTWIARSRITPTLEFLLPYIVERKRLDDLGHSIKDGRYREQKFRLRSSNIENVIYLVEHYSYKHAGLPLTSINQAVINTIIHDGFKIQRTKSLADTVQFLVVMTKRLVCEFKDNQLIGCNRKPASGELMTFNYFTKSSSKTKPLTVREMFIKMLLQIRGVSVEKALAITSVYGTPKLIMNAYRGCNGVRECERLLSDLTYGESGKKVGPSVSRTIYQLFCYDF